MNTMNTMNPMNPGGTMNKVSMHRPSVLIVALSLVFVAGLAVPGSAQTTTLKPQVPSAPPGVGGIGGPNRAFCRQVTDSQAVIASATGDAIAKLDLTAKEWVKIEAQAPTEIKPKVAIVRIAFQAAAKAKSNTAVKVQAVTEAGKAITTFVSAGCGSGPGGNGGPNSAAFTAYRDCLIKNGLTLPTPGGGPAPAASGATSTVARSTTNPGQTRTAGQGRRGGIGQLDASDPKVVAAMKACQSKLPAAGLGGGGFGGGGQGLRDCLAKKKITFAPGQGGTNGQPDAKTQKAIDECRAEATAGTTTTTKKK